MTDSSAGVSLDAMLFAMAALSLISEPVSGGGAEEDMFADMGIFAAIGADDTEEASMPAPPNHDDT